MKGFPRLYVAASLKHLNAICSPGTPAQCFPRLYVAASLKLGRDVAGAAGVRMFSAALCRGLIEAGRGPPDPSRLEDGFPRLYVAASLKLAHAGLVHRDPGHVFRGFMSRPH